MMSRYISLAKFFFLSSLIAPLLASPGHSIGPPLASCPTVTKTTSRHCFLPTPSSCVVPECILLENLDIPCGCPTDVATVTSFTACSTGCHGGCETAYRTNLLCNTTSTSIPSTITSKPTCATVTKTDGPNCPTTTCLTQAECIALSSVTLSCGCTSITETTSCKTTCKEPHFTYKVIEVILDARRAMILFTSHVPRRLPH